MSPKLAITLIAIIVVGLIVFFSADTREEASSLPPDGNPAAAPIGVQPPTDSMPEINQL